MRAKKETEIWSLDTEDDSCGNPTIINFFDGDTHHTFFNRESAIEFLQKARGVIQIWCTNLGYDITNLFGEYLNVLEITYIESRVISAKIVGTQVHFRDSLNHWKISVREMGERIGLHKMEVNGNFQNVEYCRRDSEITRTFVVTMKGNYEKIGCRLKATIGSTAMDFFQREYAGRTARFIKQRDVEFMLTGYYGGRVEIFHTKPVEGQIRYFDFNSLYPAVMAENSFPILKKHKRTRNPNLEHEGFLDATVKCARNNFLPYLPYRADNGSLVFPVGRFRGVWSYFEIREALKLGYRIEKIHRALEFGGGRFHPFKNFVESLYENRLKAKAAGDELLSDSYKLLLNNLYGKFAQGNEVTKLVPAHRAGHLDSVYGLVALKKIKGEYPQHTNVIWSAYTTAFGRHKLYGAMKKVLNAGGLLLYCDTDSLIFENETPIFESSTELGKLKDECGKSGPFNYGHFKLPKLYRLERYKDRQKIYRAKGVPRKSAEEFFETGRAQFSRPYRLREALRRNMSPKAKKLIPNFWAVTQKEIRKTYDKRRVLKDGRTKPLEI